MKNKEIIENIINGNYSSEELTDIAQAVRSAQELVKQQKAAIMKATLKPGDNVELFGLSPKSINGLIATVVAVKKARVSVDIPVDYKAGRWSGAKSVDVPLSCVSQVQ